MSRYYLQIFRSSLRAESVDRNLVHAIESVVIEWTHQIHDVLKKDSAQILDENQHPGPMAEIDYWRDRAINCECIYEQVRSREWI